MKGLGKDNNGNLRNNKYKSDLLKIDEAIGSRILEMCDKFNIEVRGKGLNYRIYG